MQKNFDEKNIVRDFRLTFFGIILALIGTAVSIYSINHHLEFKNHGQTNAACNINSSFSCDAVAASEFSEILEIPLGVFGLSFFLLLLSYLLTAHLSPKFRPGCYYFYSVMTGIGALISVYLFVVSYFKVQSFCPTCIIVYVICFLQMALVYIRRKSIPNKFGFDSALFSVLIAILPIFISYYGFSIFQDSFNSKSTNLLGGHRQDPQALSKASFEIPINKTAYSGLGEDYRKGSDDAKVTIVVFSDFQCPACKNMDKKLLTIFNDYGNQILIVHKNFPLDMKCNSSLSSPIHPYACDTAVLARCAGQYDKFWEYHDLAYQNQSQTNPISIKSWASSLGLTNSQIEACLKSKGMHEKIKDDIKLGLKVGVNATPTVFINGRKVIDSRSSSIRSEINKILNKK